MLTAATASYRTSAFVIPERLEIHTRYAVLKRKIRARKRNAVLAPSVVKSMDASNASVPSVSVAIHSSLAVTSTNASRILAERVPSASTHQAVIPANAHQAISGKINIFYSELLSMQFILFKFEIGIHLQCAHRWPTTVTIRCTARAVRQTPAPADTIAKVEDAVTYAMASVVAQEPHVRWANVSVHWATSAIPTIEQPAAICEANAKSITIARVPRFASNSDVVFAIVSMHAANSNVDRMRCAFQAIIDRPVSVKRATLAIRMIFI